MSKRNPTPKIHHLIRYFFLLGILVFFGYVNRWQDEIFLILIGPILYLAQSFKDILQGIFQFEASRTLNFYGFLLPFTVIYYSFLGLLYKQLNQERGISRFFSLITLTGFLLFIHFLAWTQLSGYSELPT